MKISRRTFVILLILIITFLAILSLTLFVGMLLNRASREITYTPSNVEHTQWQLPDGAKTRLGKGTINAIKFSPDGTRFAVATTIGVWIYDAKTGNEISLLEGDRYNILDVAFSSDGHKLMGVNSAGSIPQWDTTTGTLVSVIVTDNLKSFRSVSFSEDSRYLISVDVLNDQINVFKFDDELTPLHISNIDFDFKDAHSPVIALSQDSRVLAIAMIERRHIYPIHAFNVITGTHSFTLTGHSRRIKSLAFSPDGKTLACGDVYHSIKLWDVDTQAMRSTYKAPVSFSSLSFLPNGKLLASGCHDGSIYYWNVTKNQEGLLGKVGQYFPKLRLKKHNWDVTALTFSPNGKILITGSEDGTIRSWNTETGKQQYTITGHLVEISGFATTTDEDKMLVMHTWGYQIVQWDLKLLGLVSSSFFNKKTPIAISPDAKSVVLKNWNENNPYVLWNIPKKRIKATLTGFEVPMYLYPDFIFSRDNMKLATTKADQQNSVIHLWNIPIQLQSFLKQLNVESETIHPDISSGRHTGAFGALAFSPTGNLLVSVDKKMTIYITDVEQGITNFILTEHKESIRELAFSPSGRILASMSHDVIYLWDIATQRQMNYLQMDETGSGLRFSPDGNTIVYGTYKGEIHLLDSETLDRLSSHIGHTSWINAIIFLDNGKTLASGSRDGTIMLWDWEKITQGNYRK